MKMNLPPLPLLALMLVAALAGGACSSSKKQTDSTPTQSAISATATEKATEEVEAAASTFVEAWETFDYSDQEARYNRVLPLLAPDRRSRYTGFYENRYASEDELTGTTSVTASQVTDASGNNVTVAVTTKRFRHFIAHLPGPKSQLIEQSSLEQVECHLTLEGGQWLVTKWQIVSERLLPSEATPTPFGTTPSPYAWDPVISMVATDFTESYSSSIAEDVWSGERGRYTDSSGTVWLRFGGLSHWYANDQLVTEPFSGVMKETSGGSWELVSIGTSGVECGVPTDVQSGLGFLVCPPGPEATAWAEGDEQADQAIKEFSASRGPGYNARVDDKRFYADSSGALWLHFNISPTPNWITDPARGFMVKPAGGEWMGVSGPGTALVECDVPAEVQVAFGYGTCLPDEGELDQAIKSFIEKNEPSELDDLIIDRKVWDDSSSNRGWVQCGALLVRSNGTEQVYCLMRRTQEGDWEGVAGPSTDQTVWCSAPADVLPHLGAVKCPTPTPTAS